MYKSLIRSLGLLALFIGIGPVGASALTDAPPSVDDPQWLPWVGCWVEAGVDDADALLLCLQPGSSGEGVELVTYRERQAISHEEIRAGGLATPIEEGGCAGERTAVGSRHGFQIFVTAELTCGEGLVRTTRGVWSLLPDGETWIEIQAVHAGEGDPILGIRTFRAATGAEMAARGVADPTRDIELAVQTARAQAGAPLTRDGLVESVSVVGPSVTSALLVEREDRFELDARVLRELSDRGVPGGVLDLMVAMNHPERFEVSGGTRSPQPELRAPAAAPETAVQRTVAPWPTRTTAFRSSTMWRTPMYYDPFRFGYHDPFWSGSWAMSSWYGSYYRPLGYGWVDPRFQRPTRVIRVEAPTVRDRTRLDPERGIVSEGDGARRAVRSASPPSSSSGASQAPPPTRSTPPATSSGGGGTRLTPQGARSGGGSASGGARTAQPRTD